MGKEFQQVRWARHSRPRRVVAALALSLITCSYGALAFGAGPADWLHAGDTCPADQENAACNTSATGSFKCLKQGTDIKCTDTANPSGGAGEQVPSEDIAPKLNVPIPTLPEFSKIMVSGDKGNRTLDIPWIAQYVTALYRFGVGIAGILAVVMIMIGGVQYLMAGGDASRVTVAKQKINDAVIGLVLAFGTYLILSVVNPAILNLHALKVLYIEPEVILFTADAEENDSAEVATDFKRPMADNIDGSAATLGKIPADLTPLLEQAAADLKKQGYGILLTSGFRDPKDQLDLISKNCQNPAGSKTCNKLPGKASTCTMYSPLGPPNTDPRSCPHTTGRALDMWGTKCTNGKCSPCICNSGCELSFNDCNTGKMQQCADNVCQKALIVALGKVGFCRWPGEAWHFEKPAMSKPCNLGQ